jgi:Type I restriction enzyme R protein N terminus (HSDR_N)
MEKADLVALREGKPLVVVEAKRRPVPPSFREAVLQQLKDYGEATQSRWLLLADPRSVDIYRNDELEGPKATLDTREILDSTELSSVSIIGESILLLAIERWMRALRQSSLFASRHPELTDFVRDVAVADDFVREFHVH